MTKSSGGGRWKEPTLVIGVVGLVIALLAFGRDLFGFEFTPSRPAVTPTSLPAETSDLPVPTNSPASTSAPAVPSGIPLADLTPKVGGSWIERRAGTNAALDLACGTNTDGDKYRAVQYAIPRRYVAFHARVAPVGVADDVQVEIRVDNVRKSGATLRPNQPDVTVSAVVTGGATLELRLTCAHPGGKVTFFDAVLTN